MNESTSKTNSFDFVSCIKDCLMFILAAAMKPLTAIKSKIEEYSDVKKCGILVGVVALGRMLINLLSNIISVVFVKQYNLFKGTTSLEVSFDNLGNLNYFDLIVKQFIGFIIVVAAVAGIYYIVSMIMKKNTNYFKLAAITAVSFVPLFVAGLLAVILSYIWVELGVFIVFAALVYSVITFVYSINQEVKFDDKNFMIYFQTICFTIIFIVAYYVLKNGIFSALGVAGKLF